MKIYFYVIIAFFVSSLCALDTKVSIPSLLNVQYSSGVMVTTNSIRDDCMKALAGVSKELAAELKAAIIFEGWPEVEIGVPKINLDLEKFNIGEMLTILAEYHGGIVEFDHSKITVRGPQSEIYSSQWFAVTPDLLAVVTEKPKLKSKFVTVEEFVVALQESKIAAQMRIMDINEKSNTILIGSSIINLKRIDALLILSAQK
ncbi:hypothetical protein [Prosthecobacter dejongeii]|uniref:Uncharacterized protein n=1 Tax=Prosthecobacter dejongeii TaxID=48465 RepID=A0A7W7YGY3_9BACT|nr:hypothetical protein [Prosthecobacter dejongeii]MBB5035802.1 hypothetical protein [Prosthecobacter dejongeii]